VPITAIETPEARAALAAGQRKPGGSGNQKDMRPRKWSATWRVGHNFGHLPDSEENQETKIVSDVLNCLVLEVGVEPT
jgi:hypothetical protein